MNDLVTKIVVDLDGNFRTQSVRFGNSIEQMSTRGRRQLGLLRKTSLAVSNSIDRMGNRYTAILGGAATVAAIKGVKDLQTQLTRLKTDANLTNDQIISLRDRLFELAQDPDVRVAPQQILAGFKEITSRTGDIQFADDNLKNIALTIQGFGADAQSAGALLSQFWEKGVRAPEDVLATNDRLFTQFTKGSVSVAEIGRVAPELFSQIQNQGPEAIAQMGGLLQLFAKTTGSAQKATTAVAAVLRTFSDANKVKALEQNGIQVFKDGSVTELRDVNEILREIIERAKSNPLVLRKIFQSEEATQGLNSLLREENRDLLDDLIEGNVEYGRTLAAAAENAKTMDSALASIKASVDNFANQKLSGPITELADVLNSLDPDQIQQYFEYAAAGVALLGGAIIANKVMRGVGGIARGLGSLRGGKTGGVTGALTSVSATPVWVVNMPGGGLPGDVPGRSGPRNPRASRTSTFRLLKGATPSQIAALGAGATGTAAGYLGGTVINQGINAADRNFGTELGNQIGKAVAAVLAGLGNDNAQNALAIAARNEGMSGELTIKVEPTGRTQVRGLSARNMDIDVVTGVQQ